MYIYTHMHSVYITYIYITYIFGKYLCYIYMHIFIYTHTHFLAEYAKCMLAQPLSTKLKPSVGY